VFKADPAATSTPTLPEAKSTAAERIPGAASSADLSLKAQPSHLQGDEHGFMHKIRERKHRALSQDSLDPLDTEHIALIVFLLQLSLKPIWAH
jgi:hypothetical protein